MVQENNLRKDLFRYSGVNNKRAFINSIIRHSGARFIFLFRICNKYKKSSIPGLIGRIWIKFLSHKKNIEIPHRTLLGSGIYFGHFQNIIVNQNCTIGQNCNIMQGVTLGNESRGKRKGAPVIGNQVTIGPNSVIVGNIKIGNNVLIGPLTFVNFDVPDFSVVIGNPGKIVSNHGSTGYINKILEY